MSKRLTVLEAVHAVEDAIGYELSSSAKTRMKRDPAFASFRDHLGDVDEVVAQLSARGRERELRSLTREDSGTDGERAFRRAVSAAAFAIASEEAAVITYRSTVLGSGLLGIDEIQTWVGRVARREGGPVGPLLTFPIVGGVGGWRVKEGGALDELRLLGGQLSTRYGWEESWAVAFVLSDAVPLVSTMTVTKEWSHMGPGTVTVRAAIEVSPESVYRAYSAARDSMAGHRYRPISTGVWNAVEFAAFRGWTPWSRVRTQWAREHEGYGSDRAFARAVRSGLKRLQVEFHDSE